jgi:hypothetical protein
LQPVIQPPAIGSQGFDEIVQSVVLVPVPVALGAQLIETVIPFLSPALKLLSTMNENAGEGRFGERTGAEPTRKSLEFNDESTYLEDLPRRTTMDSQGLAQRVVEQDLWSRNYCHGACSAWASLK